jgi:hypothetical protein
VLWIVFFFQIIPNIKNGEFIVVVAAVTAGAGAGAAAIG